jgi:hypothetical protein
MKIWLGHHAAPSSIRSRAPAVLAFSISASCCSGIHLGARGARKVEIVNIGLEPWEAVEMGLFV